MQTYVYICTYMYIYAYICTYKHTHACMHAPCTHACTYICIFTCTHAHMHTCIHAYMHSGIHAYMHTCPHAYMHIYTAQGKGGKTPEFSLAVGWVRVLDPCLSACLARARPFELTLGLVWPLLTHLV